MGVSRRSRVYKESNISNELKNEYSLLTSNFLNPNRVAMLAYGTLSFMLAQPFRLRYRKCGTLDKAMKSCVSNQLQYSMVSS